MLVLCCAVMSAVVRCVCVVLRSHHVVFVLGRVKLVLLLV